MYDRLAMPLIVLALIMNSYVSKATVKTLKALAHKRTLKKENLKPEDSLRVKHSKKLSDLKRKKSYNTKKLNVNQNKESIKYATREYAQRNEYKQNALDRVLMLLALSYCLYKVSVYGYNLYNMNIPYIHQYFNSSNFMEPGWMNCLMNGLLRFCPHFIINGSRHVRLIGFALGTTIQAIAFKTAAYLVLFGAKADVFDLYKKAIQQLKRTMCITKEVMLYS